MSAIDTLLKAHETKRSIEDMEAEIRKITKRTLELNGAIGISKKELQELSELAFEEWEQENARTD